MMNELIYASPLLLIGLVSIITLMIDAFTPAGNKKPVYIFSIAGLILTAASAVWTLVLSNSTLAFEKTDMAFTGGMVSFGGYSAFFDILFCLAAIMTILAAKPYFLQEDYDKKEFYSMLLFATSGMMVIAHSANMLSLFIGIEIMSISFYILAGYFRFNIKSVEASLKYFLLGAFATGFLTYGMAMIYGATGSLDLQIISTKVQAGEFISSYMNIGLALILVGLSFKVAAFPFHQWAPDVYTGAPTVITAFMSTAGKAAALIAFIIIARALFNVSDLIPEAAATKIATTQNIIAVIAALTMLVGNLSALVQKNIKRMLAYSSVAHAGYLLMGIVANNQRGWSGIVFYATAYMFMQIGSFVVLAVMEREQGERNLHFDDYKGLHYAHPVLAAIMAIFMFSLAGIPPFAGFFGKYLLFTSVIEAGYTWLTIVAVISSIISMYFYIGLIVYMYFREGEGEALVAKTGNAKITLALSTIGVLLFGIYPPLLHNVIKLFF